jgi:hypothetical protein
MYFSHWEPPGVCERMWSENLKASIWGENETLGGPCGQPLKQLGSLMTGTGAQWERFWNILKHLWLLPNQCGNSKLTLRDVQILINIHPKDCRTYLRFSWCTASNKNTLQVWCIDYCSSSTSKSYYSTQHSIQHSSICVATLRRTTEYTKWLTLQSRSDRNNKLTKWSEWHQSYTVTVTFTKSPSLWGLTDADTYNSSMAHRSLRRPR